jgi:hypothetical protein
MRTWQDACKVKSEMSQMLRHPDRFLRARTSNWCALRT